MDRYAHAIFTMYSMLALDIVPITASLQYVPTTTTATTATATRRAAMTTKRMATAAGMLLRPPSAQYFEKMCEEDICRANPCCQQMCECGRQATSAARNTYSEVHADEPSAEVKCRLNQRNIVCYQTASQLCDEDDVILLQIFADVRHTMFPGGKPGFCSQQGCPDDLPRSTTNSQNVESETLYRISTPLQTHENTNARQSTHASSNDSVTWATPDGSGEIVIVEDDEEVMSGEFAEPSVNIRRSADTDDDNDDGGSCGSDWDCPDAMKCCMQCESSKLHATGSVGVCREASCTLRSHELTTSAENNSKTTEQHNQRAPATVYAPKNNNNKAKKQRQPTIKSKYTAQTTHDMLALAATAQSSSAISTIGTQKTAAIIIVVSFMIIREVRHLEV